MLKIIAVVTRWSENLQSQGVTQRRQATEIEMQGYKIHDYQHRLSPPVGID